MLKIFTLEKYQAPHQNTGDSEGKTVPMLHGRLSKELIKAVSPLTSSHPTLKLFVSRPSSVHQLSFPQAGEGLAATPEELVWSRVCTGQRTAASHHLQPRQECSSLPRTHRGIQCLPSSQSCKRQEDAFQCRRGSARQSSSTLPPDSPAIPAGCLRPCLAQQRGERRALWNRDATMTTGSIQQNQRQCCKAL